MRIFLIFFYILSVTVSIALAEEQITDSIFPEGSTSLKFEVNGKSARSDNWMVVTANPLASEVGAKVLQNGGTAADAMVAVQAMLGLVEPQSSGLGGGAFLVWFDAKTKEVTTLDGRETAPSGVNPEMFLGKNGKPLKFFEAVVGGLSVGVPGTPALMEVAQKRWGNQTWSSLFMDAIYIAETGFKVSPRLAKLIDYDQERLKTFNSTATYFSLNGEFIKAGEILRNSHYAETLKTLALNGSKSFYSGEIAKGIVNTVQNKNNNPGVLSLSDLNNYKVKEREAICSKYRGFDICGMGPPSSGALSVGIILGILENFDLRSLGPKSAEAWRLIGDASRLSFADRGRYMADSDFVFVPVKALLNKDYLGARAKLLQTGRALKYVHPGVPSYNLTNFYADDQSIELPSTSHISIVDSYGNALAMTTTIENAFGSRLMTPGGFLLNNELTDFSFKTNIDGVPIANRVEPVKRPRSSMSPTIVLKDNKPVLVLGSTGGSGIIGFVVKTIIAHIDWGMDVKAAIDFPNLINRFGTFDIEMGAGLEKLADQLMELGFVVKIRPLNSGTHAISLSAAGLHGAADYRREGIALGF
jgi:gamma-glutamyltranspeptidase/glutathione hydrolase